VVFLPLVGFDRRGGAPRNWRWYYDRAVRVPALAQRLHAPRLVGLAYGLQQLEHITAAAMTCRWMRW